MQNRADRFSLERIEEVKSVTSFLNKTAEKIVPGCILVISGMQTIDFLFKHIGFYQLIM